MRHEYFENIRVRLESGSNIEGQLDDALNMYRSINNWKRIQVDTFLHQAQEVPAMAAHVTPNEEGMRQRRRSRCALSHLIRLDRSVVDLISSPELICDVIFWPAW
jgi:hypothetical protein